VRKPPVVSVEAEWVQPSLASSQIPPDLWERDQRPPAPLTLTDDVAAAGDLVAAGGCSPQCLVSRGACGKNGCACSCSGRYHGVLAGVDVRQALAQRAAAE
jgi:hypothetical protein